MSVGLVACLFVFQLLFVGKTTRFDEAAMGIGEAHYAVIDGVPVHCTSVLDADKCVRPALSATARRRYLWLGNSQLHTINQRQESDRSAPELLHLALRRRGDYLITFSEPNANLQEHLVLAAYLFPRLTAEGLILPVVFDDFRETGIRNEIELAFSDEGTRQVLAATRIGKELLEEHDRAPRDKDDLAGLASTAQERSERFLTTWLSQYSKAWDARREARGQILTYLYEVRNTIFGIKPTTARKVIPGRFTRNWAALEAIVDLGGRQQSHVYMYVVPLRSDVKIPYDERQYESFKNELKARFGHLPNVTLLNLEHLVDSEYWGTKPGTALGEESELDFMHFQARGHEKLANALFKTIVATDETAR